MKKNFSISQRGLKCTVVAACCVLMIGCAAQKAVVYPKGGPLQQPRIQQELARCEQLASTDVGRNHRHALKQRSLTAGASDAAEDVASAWVKGEGDLWREGLAGGLGGIAGALVKSLIERNKPDGVYEKYVEACMTERGHRVLGWR